MALPLEGIKVVDFTGVQAGPACTQLLAWFGADVLKVERPGVGDVTRRQLRDVPDLDALYFITLNSNKKSLTLNTKTPEGKAIMEKLIREADVLVENSRQVRWTGWASPGSTFKNSTRGSSSAQSRASARGRLTRTSRFMTMWRSAPAAPPRRRDFGTARRRLAVRRWETAIQECTWRSAS
jgi:hypothetical protein